MCVCSKYIVEILLNNFSDIFYDLNYQDSFDYVSIEIKIAQMREALFLFKKKKNTHRYFTS